MTINERDSIRSGDIFDGFASANRAMLIIGEVEGYEPGRLLYPPSFVVLRNRLVEPGLSSRPGLFTEGTLTRHEAAAALFLSGELNLILQSGEYSSDFIDGVTEFGKQLAIAAGIRCRARDASGWSQIYQDPLERDGFEVGRVTTYAIKEYLASRVGTSVGASQEKARGIDISRDIYLDGLRIAKKYLGQKFEPVSRPTRWGRSRR